MGVLVTLPLDMCSHLETTTVGDQLEAVKRGHNHAPKEKVQTTRAEGSVDQRENVSRTSINMAGIRHDKRTP